MCDTSLSNCKLLALALCIFSLVLLLAPIPTYGQSKFLTFTQVLTDSIDDVDGLNGVNSVAISPDGKHLYAASDGDFSVALFQRNAANGKLTFVDLWRDGIGGVEGLDGARHVSISPDGKNVYVAAANDRTVAVFSRNTTNGQLTFLEVADLGALGSGPVIFVTISPDGRDVYVATDSAFSPARVTSGIAHSRRDLTNGRLVFNDVYQDGQSVDSLDGEIAIAISPDGKNVYATATRDSALTVFSRNSSSGELTVVETEHHRSGAVDGLSNPQSVVVSPDGKHLYVVDNGSPYSVAAYARNSGTGEVDFIEVESQGVNGVTDMIAAYFGAISPDGSHVFVAAWASESIVTFERNFQNGKLDFAESISRSDLASEQRDALSDPRSIAISPDNAFVYTVANSGNSIGVFKTATGGGNPTFQINAGLSGAWKNPAMFGQGFFIDVYPKIGSIFFAWFTYDTERPAEGVTAFLGDPGHRWLTAFGDYADNRAVLDIEVTTGGVFVSPTPVPTQKLDGTISIEFNDCSNGTMTYDIPSINWHGSMPIQRIVTDNVELCESMQ